MNDAGEDADRVPRISEEALGAVFGPDPSWFRATILLSPDRATRQSALDEALRLHLFPSVRSVILDFESSRRLSRRDSERVMQQYPAIPADLSSIGRGDMFDFNATIADNLRISVTIID